jgi:hypothetical protein
MENNFTPQELNQYRVVMQVFGQLYGRKVVCPLSDNLDLNHKENEKKGVNPRFAQPIKKFYTKTVDLTSFELSKNANGKPVIIINHDPQLTFPLVTGDKPSILECDQKAVNEALIQYEQTGKVSFFTDLEKVNDVITTLNEQNAADLEDFADKCITQAGALRTLNKSEKAIVDEYYKSFND